MAFGDIKAGGAFVELMLKDKSFKRKLKAAGKSLLKFAAAGVIAAKGLAIASVVAFARMGDSLDKMSKRTGVSVEALSQLKRAADLAGTNINTVEKSIRFMQKTLGDAERDLSTANDALEILNLELAELKKLSPEKQFNKIAEAIAEIQDPTERASAAMLVFGSRAGTQLLPMVESLAEARRETRRLNLVMSTQAATAAANLTDSFGDFGAQTKMVFFELGAVIAPFIEKVIRLTRGPLAAAIGGIREWGKRVTATLATVFVNSVLTVGKIVGEVTFALDEWRSLLELGMLKAGLSIVKFAGDVRHVFGSMIPAAFKIFWDITKQYLEQIAAAFQKAFKNIRLTVFQAMLGINSALTGGDYVPNFVKFKLGWKEALEELPDITNREMGALEQVMTARVEQLGKKVGKKHKAHMLEIAKDVMDLLRGGGNFAGAGGGDDDDFAFDFGAAQKRVFATFSAAAAQAQGMGGKSPEVKAIDKLGDKLGEKLDKLRDKVEAAGQFAN